MKSWHIERRSFLRGVGVNLALPWLEAMSWAREAADVTRRMGSVYFPYGIPTPPPNHPSRQQHGWFPVGEGRDFRFIRHG